MIYLLITWGLGIAIPVVSIAVAVGADILWQRIRP